MEKMIRVIESREEWGEFLWRMLEIMYRKCKKRKKLELETKT